jgi:hypothetical protein
MKVETNLADMVEVIDRSIFQLFRNTIREKLWAHANVIVEETADKLAAELMLKVESMTDPLGDVKLHLHIRDKEKRFEIQKSVKET